jgi:hypothetical protein
MSVKKSHARINFLLRVKLVQERFSEYDDGTRPVTTIHKSFIYPHFFISYATLQRYLTIKVKDELIKIKGD